MSRRLDHHESKDRSPRRRSEKDDRERINDNSDLRSGRRPGRSPQRHDRSSGQFDRHKNSNARDNKTHGRSRSRGRDRKEGRRSSSRDRDCDRREERSRPAQRVRRSPPLIPPSNVASTGPGSYGLRIPEGHSSVEDKPPSEDPKKDKPNFGLSGKLLEDTNMVNGVVITYSQPPEARVPKVRWRLYPFKGTEGLPTMYIHRQSAYLLGRDRRIVDIPLDHPSCSKQHAVIQYRMVPVEKDDGTVVRRVKPYLIDMNSGNGTFVNGKKIEPQRFVELLEKDIIKFGFSSREYVMLHEGSKDDEYHSDDDQLQLELEDDRNG